MSCIMRNFDGGNPFQRMFATSFSRNLYVSHCAFQSTKLRADDMQGNGEVPKPAQTDVNQAHPTRKRRVKPFVEEC